MEKIREKIREKSWNVRKNENMFEKTNERGNKWQKELKEL